MADYYHVDTQFLGNALAVFEDIDAFEAKARSGDTQERARNVATLVDALDLCNLLVLGDGILYDIDVGGGRQELLRERIERVARSLGDAAVGDMFRSVFAGVAPASKSAARRIELEAAKDAASFFPRLARCATNVLDLFHLPRNPPTAPAEHLLRYVEAGKPPQPEEIDAIANKPGITGRRFYAAILAEETAFKAICDARQRVALTDDALAVLFMNFRLRLAEARSAAEEKHLVAGSDRVTLLEAPLVYLPSMGRRDFSREFTRFVRWGSDPGTRPAHTFDQGLREYVVQQWEGVGCQIHLSDRRAIPIVIASVIGAQEIADCARPQTLLTECLRWKRENTRRIAEIRAATEEFEALDEPSRRKASAHVAFILNWPSSDAARNQALIERFALKEGWLGLSIRSLLSPLDSLTKLAIDSTDKVRRHFETVRSREYITATHLSEAARPVLAGMGPHTRQRLVDIFGGTVLDARNPNYDPDRFPAAA